jgi:uncharacterized membrane protein
MDTIDEILGLFRDPHARHAMMVHLPIVMGLLGVPLTLAVLLGGARSLSLKVVTIVVFLLAGAGAALAASSGEEAESRLEARGLTAVEQGSLHRHEELGEGGWIWPLLPAGLTAITLIPARRRAIPMIAAGLAVAGSLGVAGWVVITAHAGGSLVYVHGLGVPQRTPGPIIDRD